MKGKAISGLMLTLLFSGFLILAFGIQLVYAETPVADFNWVPTFPYVGNDTGDNVTLTSTSTPNGGEIVSYNWTPVSLGDKAHWTSPNNASTRTFQVDEPGDIYVTLNVTDSEGEWDTVTKNIVIYTIGPWADYGFTPVLPSQGDTLEFFSNGSVGVSYDWVLVSLGGSASWTSPNNGSTRTLYAQGSGKIAVSLKVTDYGGYWDTETKNITIRAPPEAVGGVYIPVNKLELLAPYVGLTILLALAVTTVFYVKKRKRNRD